MNLNVKILCVCFLLSFSVAAGNGIRERSENFITESCGSDTEYEFKKFDISSQLKNKIEQECEQNEFQN